MKKLALSILFVMACSAAMFAAGPILATATIPFDFNINGTNLSAGVYEIGSVGNGFLVFRNVNNGALAAIATSSVITKSDGLDLMFRVYGGNYFLGQVSDPSLRYSVPLLKSKSEKLAERRFANRNMLAMRVK